MNQQNDKKARPFIFIGMKIRLNRVKWIFDVQNETDNKCKY